jgi:V/A-type H+-transporting ATPase subunit E
LGPGYRGNLHLARDRADISGGFILRRGQVQINASIEVLIQRAREELEMELTNELFGE